MSYYPELDEIASELDRQERKWGVQNHPDGTGLPIFKEKANSYKQDYEDAALEKRITWRHVLLEEVYEALAENDPKLIREELIQVAAVCIQWVLAIDRRSR